VKKYGGMPFSWDHDALRYETKAIGKHFMLGKLVESPSDAENLDRKLHA